MIPKEVSLKIYLISVSVIIYFSIPFPKTVITHSGFPTSIGSLIGISDLVQYQVIAYTR